MSWLFDPIIIGLLFDIAGAGVIAWPDIPKASRYLRTGRLRLGKHRLESRIPLLEKMIGHKEIVEEIAEFHRRIKNDPEYEVDNLGDSIPLTIYEDKISTPPSGDQKEPLKVGEYPYSVIQPVIENKIRKQETRVRALGFLCLALGFLLQLIGQLI